MRSAADHWATEADLSFLPCDRLQDGDPTHDRPAASQPSTTDRDTVAGDGPTPSTTSETTSRV